MSHIVEITTEVRDEAAVRAACVRLQLATPEQKTVQALDIGALQATGETQIPQMAVGAQGFERRGRGVGGGRRRLHGTTQDASGCGGEYGFVLHGGPRAEGQCARRARASEMARGNCSKSQRLSRNVTAPSIAFGGIRDAMNRTVTRPRGPDHQPRARRSHRKDPDLRGPTSECA